MTPRLEELEAVAASILRLESAKPVRVAIDGRTASGKTTLADEFGAILARTGREVIRTSIDGFHRPKVERYARGRHSHEGYYHDARDLAAIRTFLLDPLGPGGNRSYRTETFDLERDQPVATEPKIASASAILVVDGTFLQRPELREGWDATIFVQASEAAAEGRGVARDADRLGGLDAARELYRVRYRPAFDLYDRLCAPASNADTVVDNEDFERPLVFVRPGGRLS